MCVLVVITQNTLYSLPMALLVGLVGFAITLIRSKQA